MLSFLHIPKTGGSARRSALRSEIDQGRVLYQHHERNARVAPGQLVLYLRDPLAKFVSGFDAFRDIIAGTMGAEYDDINYFVEDIDHALRDCGDTTRLLFRPQWWWDAPGVHIRLKSEHMDTSFPQLLRAHGLRGKLPARSEPSSNTNHSTRSVLNEASIAYIRERYTDDFPLWEAAEGEYDASRQGIP